MRVLVVGSGAREHALAWKLSRSPAVDEVFAAPGNPGIAGVAECVPIASDAIVELAEFAADLHVDLTVVGPELPLVLGIADEFDRRGLALLGPSRSAAELEGSKVFTKEFCERHRIPTAKARVVHDRGAAAAAVKELGVPVVLKADGLAAGKGVFVCSSRDEVERAMTLLFDEHAFGGAGEKVVVEECILGHEVSFMVLTDGVSIVPLASARDYKRLGDGDTGPNTGGMGSVSPAALAPEVAAAVLRDIIHPTLAGMAAEGRTYRGVLYAGLMITPGGPQLLEFNCRLGDPETQVVLPRLDDDLLPLLVATTRGELAGMRATWRHEAAACVVLAAAGYPGTPRRDDEILGLADALAQTDVMVFHAGTATREGALVTAGGRVLSVVGRGASVADACSVAYRGAAAIRFAGQQLRTDVGRGLA